MDFKAKLPEIEAHWRDLNEQLSHPDVTKDIKRLASLSRSHKELTEVLEAYRQVERLEGQADQAREMTGDSDEEMAAMAAEELAEAETGLEAPVTPVHICWNQL